METVMSWGAGARQGARPGQVRVEEEAGFAETALRLACGFSPLGLKASLRTQEVPARPEEVACY